MEAETIKSENLSIPEDLEHDERIYTLHSVKDHFCYMICNFKNCKGKIKYIFLTKTIFSWSAHSAQCRKNKYNERKLPTDAIVVENEHKPWDIVKLEDHTFINKTNKINPLDLLNKNYKSVQIKTEEAKTLYLARIPTGAKSLLNKLKKNNGKTFGIFVNNCLASSVSYIEWKINNVEFKEIVLLATDESQEKKGMGKHLMVELMCIGQVVAWADIGALDFYKKLGFVDDNVLGWEIANKISYATYSVFVQYGITDEERKKLIG